MATKKRKHGFLKFLLIFLLVIILLPVAVYFIFLHDTSRHSLNIDEDFNTSELANRLFVDSLDHTVDEHKISIAVSQDDLNNIFYQVTSGLDESVQQFDPQLDVVIEDDCYKFYLPVKWKFLGTKLVITTKLEEVDDDFVFNVTNISIGRISGLQGIATKILSNYITDDTITDAFKNNVGLNIQSKLMSEKKLVYNKAQFIADFRKLAGMDGSSGLLGTFMDMTTEFAENGNLTFDFYSNKSLSMNIDTTAMNHNAAYIDGNTTYTLGLDEHGASESVSSVRDALETKVDDGLVSVDDIQSEFQNTVSDYAETVTSQGSEGKLTEQVSTQLASSILVPHSSGDVLASLDEENINDYLKTTSLIGQAFAFNRDDDGSRKINYIVMDNFYVEFAQTDSVNRAYFNIGVDINGEETYVVMDTEVTSTANHKISFHIDKSYFGTIAISDSLLQGLLDIVTDGLSSDDSITIDGSAKTITIDLSSVFSGSAAFIGDYVDIACDHFPSTASDDYLSNGDGVFEFVYNA